MLRPTSSNPPSAAKRSAFLFAGFRGDDFLIGFLRLVSLLGLGGLLLGVFFLFSIFLLIISTFLFPHIISIILY